MNCKKIFSLICLLIIIMLNIFFFSIYTILVSIVILILGIYKYFSSKNKLVIEEKEEIKEKIITKKTTINTELPENFNVEEFENIVKNIYLDMQKYFMNLEYESLKEILDEELYNQFEIQMKHLENNNKRAVRENIELIDFKINEYKEQNNEIEIKVSIGVYEDKYTKNINNHNIRPISYENYYEILLIKNETWKIKNLKLLYSHSKKN